MTPPASPTELSHPKYRPDIDGLRAIAVLSVVGFHAFPDKIVGGFIGVDIFFVISGYLISTIIFENLDRGSFSFFEFYARRINRIFPALIVILVSCYAMGWFALLADEFQQLGKHIAAGAGFVSNIVLWSEDGYFDNSAETKPLLHLWSLGIEEQFYIVWPFLLWLAWKRNFNLLTVTFLLVLVSFYLNVKGIEEDAIATFYSPQTRFWELLCGSLLAWMGLYKTAPVQAFKSGLDVWLSRIIYRDIPDSNGSVLSNTASYAGLLLLLVGFFSLDKAASFPGYWAVVPVVGAVLLIFAGPQAHFNRIVLSNKIAVWFGLISFPLYLWHWPLLSFARISESGDPGWRIRGAAVVLAVVLAWLTYRFIERPFRLGKRRTSKVIGLTLLMIIVGYVGYNTFAREGLAFRSASKVAAMNSFAATYRESCKPFVDKGTGNDWCRISEHSDATKLFLFGDSHANSISTVFSSLRKQPKGFDFLQLGRAQCPALLAFGRPECRDIAKKSLEVASNSSVQAVVFASRWPIYINGLKRRNAEPTTPAQFKAAFRATISAYQKLGKKITVVYTVPLAKDPRACVRPLRLTDKNQCHSPVSRARKHDRNYRAFFDQIKTEFKNVEFFDPWNYLCTESACTVIDGDKLLYVDSSHLSPFGGDFLADKARSELMGMLKQANP